MNNDEIIKNSHYPAYVVASAGTGKTEEKLNIYSLKKMLILTKLR